MWTEVKRQTMTLNKRMQRSPWRHVVMVAVCLFVIYVIAFMGQSSFKLPPGIDLKKYEPFEPIATADFNVNGTRNDQAKIPKIIHWVSRTDYVDRGHVDNMKTFIKLNPDWKFFLWTESSSRKLLSDSLPELLKLWDDHTEFHHISERRFEFIRYIVLYLYGGIVLDSSARNYRPLESAITKYSCVVPPNPYEMAIITGVPYTVTNRVMICRQKHPFIKFVVENIHRYQHMATAYDSVGDGFFMTHYKLYNALQRERDDKNIYIQQNRKDTTDSSPFFFQGELAKTHPDAVYVPNSVFFTGSSNPFDHSIYIKTCSSFFTAPFLHQRACVHLHRRGMKRDLHKYAYIDLQYTEPSRVLTVDIKKAIPTMIIYGNQ